MPEPSPARVRRMPRLRVALASLACAALLGVAGCSSPDGGEPAASTAPSASPESSSAPIFASDEEALAAAVEAYEAYTEASTGISNAGGVGADAITELVDSDYNEALQEEFTALREAGLKTIGEAIHYNARLERRSESDGQAEILVGFCRDVSGTRVLQSDGVDVTPSDREPIQAVRVTFISGDTDPAALIIRDAERLEDEAGC